jgi:predicted nicotinamide N-methyase
VDPEVVSPEPIPETSLAERTVADLLPIATTPEEAVRLRDSVPLWFHTFALGHGIYTPGLARDHVYRLPVLGAERFAGRSVLDVGAFDGFYSFLAERRGARRVVAVDNEQYVDWVQARFGISLTGGDTRWTVVRGSDLEEGESQGLPVWSEHVGDPILASNLTRRVDFALFMVEALENDELVHEAPAIVGHETPSALAHAARE